MRTLIYGTTPNFSIVLPGGCNAKCDFCFWRQERTVNDYMAKLEETLSVLPRQFSQVSVTGGEPTLSPRLADVLSLLKTTRRFGKVVFTTNGVKMLEVLGKHWETFAVVNHVNVSRHYADERRNRDAFRTDNVPRALEIKEIAGFLNRLGIDVTFNCVIDDSFGRQDVLDMLALSKWCGVSAVCFRKKHGDLRPTRAERAFREWAIVDERRCPV
jgi:molybdenum cofactor biosynthesis enzyme MoaA